MIPPIRVSTSAAAALVLLASVALAADSARAHQLGFVEPVIEFRVDTPEILLHAPNETYTLAYVVDYQVPAPGALVEPVTLRMAAKRVDDPLVVTFDPPQFVLEPEPGRSSYVLQGNASLYAAGLVSAERGTRFLLDANGTASGNVESGYATAPIKVQMVPIPSLRMDTPRMVWFGPNSTSFSVALKNTGNAPLRVALQLEGSLPPGLQLAAPEPFALPEQPDVGATKTVEIIVQGSEFLEPRPAWEKGIPIDLRATAVTVGAPLKATVEASSRFWLFPTDSLLQGASVDADGSASGAPVHALLLAALGLGAFTAWGRRPRS